MAIVSSLFEVSASPVLPSATEWMTGTFGTLAIALCVVAVAFVGLMIMAGRLTVQGGLRVVLGCFVVLGAPTISLGLLAAAQQSAQPATPPEPAVITAPPPPALPPSGYDPYAGASLRTE